MSSDDDPVTANDENPSIASAVRSGLLFESPVRHPVLNSLAGSAVSNFLIKREKYELSCAESNVIPLSLKYSIELDILESLVYLIVDGK